MSRRRFGFSMISVLVLLGVLMLFFAMLFPAVTQLRRSAGRVQGINNLKQLGLAVHNYHDVFTRMPPTVGKGRDASGTVHFHLLPYLEQDALYRMGREDWTQVAGRVVPLFLDPDAKVAPPGNVHQDWLATTNYAGNWQVFRDGDMSLVNIPDGTSNTIMFTTRFQLCNDEPAAWAYNRLHYKAPMFGFYSRARFQVVPKQDQCDPGLPQSLSESGIIAGIADGSVRTVSTRCSPQTWSYASDPADGFPLADDFN